jgi:hypothetical protein
MILATPVAFLIFNRPDTTELVFQAIRQAQPKQLLLVADGPRPDRIGEIEKCQQVREIVSKVDWNCEVHHNFSEINLGCRNRVSSGLDWVFSQVEEAIVLEDDCLPSQSFFHFCAENLKRYRYDDQVMHIAGSNFLLEPQTQDSYYFSKYSNIWGWATWRRAWQAYDVDLKSWPIIKTRSGFKDTYDNKYEQQFWDGIFTTLHDDPFAINTWDYQWNYACFLKNGLAITPNQNFISNLGFNRLDATHTLGDSPRANLPLDELELLQHPQQIARSRAIDARIFDFVHDGKALREADTIRTRMGNTLRKAKRLLAVR